ncbi:hypothetical protein ACMC5R_07175 [Deferribacteres bacterium DY0037]
MKGSSYQQITEKLNTLIAMAKSTSTTNKEDFFHTYGFLESNGFKIAPEDKHEVHQVLRDSYNSLSFFNSKVSFDYFKKDIIEIIKDKLHSSSRVNDEDATLLVNKYKNLPIKTYVVYREIYGLELDQNPPKLGLFTIRNSSTLITLLKQNKISLAPETSCVIEVTVEAAEPEKAQDEANVLFEQFDFVIRYLIGDTKDLDIGITDFSVNRTFRSFVFCKGIPQAIADKGKGAIQDMTFSTIAKVTDESIMGLFEFIGNKHPSDIAKRILLAIQWISEAFKDSSNESAFLKSVVAMEILCSNNLERSISSNLAEITALLVGENYETRLKIKKDIKNLYSKRSGIVHSGNKCIENDDLKLLWFYADYVIRQLLSFEKHGTFKSIQEIFDQIEELKYNNINFE